MKPWLLTALTFSAADVAAAAVVAEQVIAHNSLLDMPLHIVMSIVEELESMLAAHGMLTWRYLDQHLVRLSRCNQDWRTGYLKLMVQTPVA